jgi:3-oxoacyl-[acyl-carrier protein] reductase
VDLGLDGRVAIITGATSGLGLAIAATYAAEGAKLMLTYHEKRETAMDLAQTLRREHAVTVEVLDHRLGDLQSAQRIVQVAMSRLGDVGVLVNNAVRFGARASAGRPFESIAEDEWRDVLRDNLEGAIQLTRLVAPSMREAKWGRLVHVSSRAASMGMAGNEYYGAAKMALTGFSRSLAFSLGACGDVLSNVVEPGFTRTQRNQGEGERMEAAIAGLSPVGRLLTAQDVAQAIVFLGSAANTGITGSVIGVSGGF